MAWDLVTAQSFLGSIGTATGLPVATSSGGHGAGRAPEALARFVGGFVRPPELVAAVAGIVLLVRSNWRRGLLPAALLVMNIAAFAIVAERHGPLEQRYLLVATAMLLVFAAYAIARATPRAVGLVLGVACVAYAPVDIGRLADLRDRVHVAGNVYSDLRDVVGANATKCALRGHVRVQDVRLRPAVAYWGGIPPARVGTERGTSGDLVALNPVATELSSRSLPKEPDVAVPPPPDWRLSGPCARQ
jgi:hypothetical protein